MVWVLNGQMDEMDRAAAAAAPVEAEEQLVEFDGVLYRQAFQSPQVMQTPRPSPASVPQAVAWRYGCQTGGAAGNLQDSRQTKARANTVARRSEDRAEVAIERLRRLREARQVASIRDGYAGTPPSRASVCYYDSECEKLDGGGERGAPTRRSAAEEEHYRDLLTGPGDESRPVLVVTGNCQAESLRLLLQSDDVRTVRVPPLHDVRPHEVEPLRRWLARTDLLVTQPVRDDYRGLPLGTDQQVAALPASAAVAVVPAVAAASVPVAAAVPLVPARRQVADSVAAADPVAVAAAARVPVPPVPSGVRVVAVPSADARARSSGVRSSTPWRRPAWVASACPAATGRPSGCPAVPR